MAFLISSTYNEYVFQRNFLLVAGIFLINYLVLHYELDTLSRIIHSRLVVIVEFFAVLIACFNMWASSKQHVQPSLQSFKLLFRAYVFDDGPLLDALRRFFCSGTKEAEIKPVTTTTPTITPTPNNNPRTLMSDALATGIPFTNANVPNDVYSFSNKSQNRVKELTLDNPLEQLVESSTQITTNFPTSYNANKKLAFKPCFNPPPAVIKHRDHSLWSLDRKPEVVDDFRDEQIENLRKNWDKFDTQTTKAVSNKLRQRIIDLIIKPILQTAQVLDGVLSNTGQTFADCTQNSMAYLMLSQTWKHLNISLSPVEMKRLTHMPNYDNVKARKYIMERMKELADSENMARFRYIAAEPDLPTDSQIIIHLVETYISIKSPSVIPPLIQDHFGDVFKYLVIYFYTTPELDWKLFDNISS